MNKKCQQDHFGNVSFARYRLNMDQASRNVLKHLVGVNISICSNLMKLVQIVPFYTTCHNNNSLAYLQSRGSIITSAAILTPVT